MRALTGALAVASQLRMDEGSARVAAKCDRRRARALKEMNPNGVVQG